MEYRRKIEIVIHSDNLRCGPCKHWKRETVENTFTCKVFERELHMHGIAESPLRAEVCKRSEK